jgi:hypothetical protein
VQLNEVVVTGTGASARREARADRSAARDGAVAVAPAAAPAEPTRERKFEMAKTAAAQRAATTLSSVDSASADLADATVRRIGARTFSLAGGMWTDVRYVTTVRTVRVKAYSAAYFALLERVEDLRAPFALMGAGGTPGVIVAGRAVAISVAADGVDTLSTRDIAAIESAW